MIAEKMDQEMKCTWMYIAKDDKRTQVDKMIKKVLKKHMSYL